MKHSSKVESSKETLAANPVKEYICTHTWMNTGTSVHEHKHIFKYLLLMCMSVWHACMSTMCVQDSEVRRGIYMPQLELTGMSRCVGEKQTRVLCQGSKSS